MGKRLDLTNKKFGRLTALKFSHKVKNYLMWECLCECGKVIFTASSWLSSGNTKSCGCYCRDQTVLSNSTTHPSRTHGMKGTPTYNSWCSMKQRCNYKKNISYPWYGGRGISVCERWQVFENFLADMGERPKGHQLDRINGDGNYEPENCRWVSPIENSRNRKANAFINIKGEVKTISEWSEISGIKQTTISERLRRGWDNYNAIFREADAAKRLSK